jgi:hypothetical protein
MTEEAMRAAFIGKTLDGQYGSGVSWTETYFSDGRLSYREKARSAAGRWYFRGNVFCTFYDPAYRPQLVGGCWNTVQAGSNCYEFFFVQPLPEEPRREGDSNLEGWNARGWRQGEPQTCEGKPTV